MAQNKILRFGPVALTTTITTNIINSTVTSLAGPIGFTMTQPYLLLRHVRITNKTGSAAVFTLFLGASAGNVAGTEVIGNATSIAANSAYDWYGVLRMDAADFLVGGSTTSSVALVFEGEGEIGVI